MNNTDLKKMVGKFAKYYTRMSGGSAEKRQMYESKFLAYKNILENSNVDTAKVAKIIQSGGDPFKDLEFYTKIIDGNVERIKKDVESFDIDQVVIDVDGAAEQAIARHMALEDDYQRLGKTYGNYVTETQKLLDIIKEKLASIQVNGNEENVKILRNVITHLNSVQVGQEFDVEKYIKDLTGNDDDDEINPGIFSKRDNSATLTSDYDELANDVNGGIRQIDGFISKYKKGAYSPTDRQTNRKLEESIADMYRKTKQILDEYKKSHPSDNTDQLHQIDQLLTEKLRDIASLTQHNDVSKTQ